MYHSIDHDDEMLKDEGEEGDSETEQMAKSLGVLRVDGKKSFYVGDTHWGAILNDVSFIFLEDGSQC